MSHTARLVRLSTLLALLAPTALSACGDGTNDRADAHVTPGLDAYVAPGTDAYVAPGTDAFVVATDDAYVPPGVDAGPIATPDAFVVGTDAAMTSGAAPSARGTYSVTESSATVMAGGRSTPVTAYVPSIPAGTTAPLVVFVPGFQLTSSQYAGTLEHLASHGFIVLGADPSASLFSANHVNMAADARAVITWATSMAPFASSVDASRIGVTGHSLGGKVATLVTMDDDRVRALYAIDPVDGDPSPIGGGSSDRPDLVPSRGGDLTVAVGFAGETTNGGSGGPFSMPCAPSDQNFEQFYAAATAASWAGQWEIEGADHMDFLDDPACGFTCSACPDGPADDATVLATNRTLLTAFFRRHLGGEAAMDAYLTGVSVPSGVTAMHR
ncbi:MAG: hypothetical protein U0353_33500 [Sandaracinus sp.]